MRQYCQVHEENIIGNTPYAQIAIEYEIEMLPLRYGAALLARCVETLGAEILPALTFVTEHMDLDVGHTKFNRGVLAKMIDLNPSSLPALAAAGTAALDAYAQFLGDCVRLAERHSNEVRRSTAVPAPGLSWRLQPPPGGVNQDGVGLLPDWLENVRSLRGSVLFDNGRRPHFGTEDGASRTRTPSTFMPTMCLRMRERP